MKKKFIINEAQAKKILSLIEQKNVAPLKKIKKKPIPKPLQIPNAHFSITYEYCDQPGVTQNYSSAMGFWCNGSMCTNADLQAGQNEFELGLYSNGNYSSTPQNIKLLGFSNPIVAPYPNINVQMLQSDPCPSVTTGGCSACTGAAGEIPGCCDSQTYTTNGDYGTGQQTISAFGNYDPNATCNAPFISHNNRDIGDACVTIVSGCTDPAAINYNANIDNSGLVGPAYPSPGTPLQPYSISDNSTCIY